jgi:hypothetical protein
MMTHGLAALAALSGLLLIGPDARVEPVVVLRVQSSSWIEGSTFAADRFTNRCAQAGVTLVPVSRPNAAAVAVLRYTEVKGAGFSRYGIGAPVGFGTNVMLEITLLDARSDRTLLTLSAAGDTPSGLAVEDFHSGAVAAFEQSAAYRHACTAIAAALGSRKAMLGLLPWALLDRQARAVVEQVGFAPDSDTERAYLAVMRRDFREAANAGAAAIEPLLLMFENTIRARNGIGLLPTSDPVNVQALLDALPVIEAQDDERTVDALVDFLTDQADVKSSSANPAHVALPIVRSVLQTLGRTGDTFTLPILEEWGRAGGPLAADAAEAAAALRRRITVE